MRTLNGWRRLGAVIVVLWLLGVVSLTAVEYNSSSSGVLIHHGLPIGTLVEGEKVTLPDGKIVTIDNRDAVTGHPLAPWQINWDAQTNLPQVTEVRWLRFGLALVLVPICVWLFFELAVMVFKWVSRGFRGGTTP